MPQKKTLKPTLILALDPFAAAFCAEVRRRLARRLGLDFSKRNTLLQACALTLGGDTLGFDFDIDRYIEPEGEYADFDLEKARARFSVSDSDEAKRLFESGPDEIADALSEILLGARSLGDIEAARLAGFDITDARLIYFVLSAADPFAVGAVLELARVIHWLFATRFQDELYTLHALVLLPELFANHGTADYVTTYGLLKKLDDAFINGLGVMARLRPRPFESCWLIDGHNQRISGTGTLAENLAGYADAFVGLLSASPEDSMAAPGMNARGRPPAYNSFGYGELYLPSEVAVTRLSAALAHDITSSFFLGGDSIKGNDERQMLNDVKRFVQSKEFRNNLEHIGRYAGGHAIWQPPNLRERLREDAPGEYIELLRQHHDEFSQGPMSEYRSALSDSSERVLAEFIGQLDKEIDGRADASPAGLQDAVEYLRLMVEHAVELRQPFGDEPWNLLTVLRQVEAMLDGELRVTPWREESAALLEKILDLRNKLNELRTDLRLLPETADEHKMPYPRVAALKDERPDEEPDDSEPESIPDDAPASVTSEPDETHTAPEQAVPQEASAELPFDAQQPLRENPRQRLTEVIEEAEERLWNLCDDYRQMVIAEDTATDALRNKAMKTVLAEKLQRIEDNEIALVKLAEELRKARREHLELLEARRQFMHRHLIVRPILFALGCLGIPLLGWAGDIWPATKLVPLALDNLSESALIFLLIVFLYSVGIFWIFFRWLRPRIIEAAAKATQLDSQYLFTATQLRDARNAHQLFKYDLYAWRVRRDVIAHLIETAQNRIRELMERLGALREGADMFARERDDAVPLASPMRRPLILAADIDAYYCKKVTSVDVEGDLFVREHKVTRSMVRRIAPEEFRQRLMAFAVERFKHLRELSITDAIFHRPDLVPENTVEFRLRELDESAEPLLRLRRGDGANLSRFAQRETTLWSDAQEYERMMDIYRRICPGVNIRVGGDGSSLRVLTRCLYFPAYFIGAIEFYRDRYTRYPNKIAAELPDVLPLDERLKRARKRFMLALAIGVVVRDNTGAYIFSDRLGESFGTDRQHIAERLSGSLGAQKLYEELDDRVDKHLRTTGSVINQLHEFLNSAADLDASERQILTALVSEYF